MDNPKIISKDSGATNDIKARLVKAQGAFSQLHSIWRSKQYSFKTKMLLYNVPLYGSETWQVIKSDEERKKGFGSDQH